MVRTKPFVLFGMFLASATSAVAADLISPTACNCQTKPKVSYKRAVNYPICFYDVELGAIGTAKAAWPSYAERLSKTLGRIAGNANDVLIIDSRRIVVRTYAWGHREISGIWPELACIGQSGGGDSVGRRDSCIAYIKADLKATSSGTGLPEDILVPICQTFLDASPPSVNSVNK